jgi:cell division septation protein DedD
LYSAAIGPISNDYYLPVFTRFEAAGRWRLAWNWAACLYTVNWMIFRGLGLAALGYSATVAGAVLLLFGLGRMIFQFSPATEFALLAALVGLMLGIPGLFGNALLHTACRKKMAAALRDSATLSDACALLMRQASSRQRFLWLVSVNTLLVLMVVALYLSLRGSPQADAPAGSGDIPTTRQNSAVHPLSLPIEAADTAASTPPPSSAPSSPGMATGVITAEAPDQALKAIAPAPAASAPKPQEPPGLPSTAPAPLVPANPTAVVSAAPLVRYRFYINVGLFAKEANAQNALNKLERAGLSTLSSTVSTPRGERTRVRAGPFNSEREANAAAEKIRVLNLDAVVMQQPL